MKTYSVVFNEQQRDLIAKALQGLYECECYEPTLEEEQFEELGLLVGMVETTLEEDVQYCYHL